MFRTHTDIIIVGAGIGGLSFALYLSKLRPNLNLKILAKTQIKICNTRIAQGGIASVQTHTNDSFQSHIDDTYLVGHKKGNLEVIQKVIEDAPNRINDLEHWGMQFDKANNQYHLHKEGGHEHHRILHIKDQTGKNLHECLLEKLKTASSVDILEYQQVENIEKIDKIFRLKIANLKTKQYYHLLSSKVIIATGGCGQLFTQTTNSLGSIGEGIYFANQLELKIKDFEKIQFHPTSFNGADLNPSFLISEAARGFGAHLINEKYQRFVFKYDSRGELAPRDIVSNAIWKEISIQKNENIFLDFTHLKSQELRDALPFIDKTCKSYGYDLSVNLIPVKPAAHYQCGGIQVNLNGESSEKSIFAIGECAYTGLHGDNRLASNSLLESLYFAHAAAQRIAKEYQSIENKSFNININKKPFSNISLNQVEALNHYIDKAKQIIIIAYQSVELKKSNREIIYLLEDFKSSKLSVKSHPKVFETKVVLENVAYLLNKKHLQNLDRKNLEV